MKLGRGLSGWERAVLERGRLLLVGGVVRDMLLHERSPNVDVDYIAAGIEQAELISLLEGMGRTDLVGKTFGVIKFRTPEGETVDISLPRSEFSTGPSHRDFNVTFDPTLPVEKDLERRDFTINSMAFDLATSRLIDPMGGRDDLEAKILRVNREDSFIEDPLRILRGVQFAARFSLTVDGGTRRLMERDAHLIADVSPERIRDELNKMMLLASSPGSGFTFMHEAAILPYVLPELDETFGVEQNEFHPDDIFHHSLKSCDLAARELHIRWSALLHDLGKKKMKQVHEGRVVFYRHEVESAEIATRILGRLAFPRQFVQRVVHLIENHMFNITGEWSDSAVRRLIAKVGRENIDDLLLLRMADGASRDDGEIDEEVEFARNRIEKIIEADSVFKREDLPIDGDDIMRITGIAQGPEVGALLDELLELVIDDPEYNDRERLLGEIEKRKR